MFKTQYVYVLRGTVTIQIASLHRIAQLILVIALHIVYCDVTTYITNINVIIQSAYHT